MINYNEIQWQENFVKVTDDPEYVISEVRSIYTSDADWVVGAPTIREVNDPRKGKFEVNIPLTKYAIDKGRSR